MQPARSSLPEAGHAGCLERSRPAGFSGRSAGAPRRLPSRRRQPVTEAVAAERPPAQSDGLDMLSLRRRLPSDWRQDEEVLRDVARAGWQHQRVDPDAAPSGEWHVSDGWRPLPHHKSKADLWEAIREEAFADAEREPALASFLHTSLLMHRSFDKSLAFFLAKKLSSPTLLGTQLARLFEEAYADDPEIVEAAVADIQAVRDRDPACLGYAQCLLYFKGFQAIQCYRVAHWMWQRGRKTLAIALQSRMSEVLHVDIHPAARLGRGILLDHATGVVVGETARVGDNVVLLHHVTLGGSGTGKGVRHPNIGNGVLLGAGVCVLGPVSIGRGSKVGAGSVVVDSLPPHCVAVGVPARVIRQEVRTAPVADMDMVSDFTLDWVI